MNSYVAGKQGKTHSLGLVRLHDRWNGLQEVDREDQNRPVEQIPLTLGVMSENP